MDSRLIFSVVGVKSTKIVWGEWVYSGANDEVKYDVVNKTINEHLLGNNFYVRYTKKESVETNKENVMADIKKILGNKDFILWDIEFNKAIEFNKIGVMRIGQVKN